MTPTVRRRWKAFELRLAAYLGGERVPVSGRTRGWAPDVQHRWLSIEAKQRSRLPAVLVDGMDQAVKAAAWDVKRGRPGKLPVVIIGSPGQHTENALLCMKLGDFKKWFGDGGP